MMVEPVHTSLVDLLKRFSEGDIALPLMQRDFVWSQKKCRDLFDSLYRGFPIGSFYLWQSSGSQRVRKPSMAAQSLGSPSCYLLDGQQRICSLLAGIARGGSGYESYEPVAQTPGFRLHPRTGCGMSACGGRWEGRPWPATSSPATVSSPT